MIEQKDYPHYTLEQQESSGLFTKESRGSVVFKSSQIGMDFTPEELIAMLLKKGKQMSITYSTQPLKDCVLTVPTYFTQEQVWIYDLNESNVFAFSVS